MNEAMLKAYLDGWAMICASTPESTEAMIAGAHPDIRFSDVNSPNVHVGHEGLRAISTLAGGKYPDARISWRDLLCDGRNWSIRWTFTGTAPDGTRFSHPGASAGSVAEDGRVIEHTDYWSRP
jgi:hypothetical protein